MIGEAPSFGLDLIYEPVTTTSSTLASCAPYDVANELTVNNGINAKDETFLYFIDCP